MKRIATIAAAALAMIGVAYAAVTPGQLDSPNRATMPTLGHVAISGATVGTAASTVVSAGSATVYLLLANPSAPGGNTVTCTFGSVATVNVAGSLTFAPGQSFTFEGSFVPVDAVSCISSGASTPFTIGVL